MLSNSRSRRSAIKQANEIQKIVVQPKRLSKSEKFNRRKRWLETAVRKGEVDVVFHNGVMSIVKHQDNAGDDVDDSSDDDMGEDEEEGEADDLTMNEEQKMIRAQRIQIEKLSTDNEEGREEIFRLTTENQDLKGERNVEDVQKLGQLMQTLFLTIDNFVELQSDSLSNGIVERKNKGKDLTKYRWLKDQIPHWNLSKDRDYQKHVLMAIISMSFVAHHYEFGPMGPSSKKGTELADFLDPYKGLKEKHLYKRLIKSAEAAHRHLRPDGETSLMRARISDLRSRFDVCLKDLTAVDVAKHVKDLNDIAERSAKLSDRIHFNQATFRLWPYGDSYLDWYRSKEYNESLHKGLKERTNEKDNRIHAIVFPGLVKNFDEQGNETGEILFQARVLFEAPRDTAHKNQ